MDTASLSTQNIVSEREFLALYRRVLEQFRDHARSYIIPYNDTKRAQTLLRLWRTSFADHSAEMRRLVPELYEEWERVFTILKWITLNSLIEEEIVNLIEKHWREVYEIPLYNVVEKFKVKCLGRLPEDRDNLKSRARSALLRNTQDITASRIVRGTREVKGTTRNWLMDYNEKLGTGEADKLQFIQYLTNSQNTQDLSEEDRSRVEALFSFYEHLKRSSSTLQGIEEEVPFVDEHGRLKIFHDGYIDDADIPEPEFRAIKEKLKEAGVWPKEDETAKISNDKLPVSNTVTSLTGNQSQSLDESILASYNTLPIPLEAIRAKTIELRERLKTSPQIVEQILARPEIVKDKAYVVAALILRITNYELRITNKEKLKQWIRETLEDKLGWGHEDSAKFGIRIGNLLGEPYKGWAAYNKTAERFEWSV